MKIIILISIISTTFAAPNGGYGGYSAPALLKTEAYAAPEYQEIHSRELTGYKNEVLRIPELHTEAFATPTHVEIRGNPYEVKSVHTETRAVQGFRDETVPRTQYHTETITHESLQDQIITVPGSRTETRAVQDYKEELVPVRVPFTRYESYEVPTEEQRVIQVPKIDYETIQVPETVYETVRIPETHYESYEVPEIRTEVAYDVRNEAGYAGARTVESIREEVHQVPIYGDVVKRIPIEKSYGGYAAPAVLKSAGSYY